MPRAEQNKAYSTLLKGLITEAGPLTFPADATTDELNCDLFPTGNRRRRLGFNVETGFDLSSQTVPLADWATYAIHSSHWHTVAGNGNLNFLVQQIGSTLYFYDMGVSVRSEGQKSFTVDLEDFAAPGATNIETSTVQTAVGKGLLFVVGEKIESFYVEYDPDEDDITTTQIEISIRDFDGLDDGLQPEEQPETLSKEHHYNLRNQGWLLENSPDADPITKYESIASKYPSNAQQWWQGKASNFAFDASILRRYGSGNTEAPKGHYIVKAFYKDRSDLSEVDNIPVESVNRRPRAVAFFAGRVWYAGTSDSDVNGNFYFSQIITGKDKVGKCYQVNDPTSEDLSDLLATDGGVISIPEVGTVYALYPMSGALLALADNGIWSIGGGANGGFKATDFSVSKVSSIGIDSPHSIVDVEGTPIWWGKTGIATIGQNEVTDRFQASNISQDTIQTFYDEIPVLSKADAKGQYDQSTKKIYWLYRNTAPSNGEHRYRFDRVLVLDTRLKAFYPWEIGAFETNPYYIGGVFAEGALSSIRTDVQLFDDDDTVLDGTDTVTAPSDFTVGSDTFLNFMCFREDTNVQWTFGNFTSTTFTDWNAIDDAGVDYDSFFETGDELLADVQRKKQATYVHVLFERTETAYTDTDYDAFIRPSSCFMRAKWEWSDHSNSNKFSPSFQVYRLQRGASMYTPSTGTDFNNGFPVLVSRNKIRGSGKALRLRFESEAGKDFNILGWAIHFTGNTSE